MSITSRINEMSSHIEQAYDELQGLGADLTNVNKNIENISMVLDDIYDSLPSVSGEGTSLTLDDTRVGKIKSTLKGNTSQDGTPTPTTPIPVNVVSGDNEINVCGKNLHDFSYWIQNINQGTNITYSNRTDSSVNITASARGYTAFGYNQQGGTSLYRAKVEPNTEYTFSYNGEFISGTQGIGTFVFMANTINGDYTTLKVKDVSTSVTFTTTSTTNYIWFRIDLYNACTYRISNIQLEKGSSATTYEPYQGNTYNIDLPEGMELCKIGNYQDYFYKDSGKWYLHKEIGKVVLNGSESWAYALQSNVSRFDTTIINAMSGSATNSPILSTHFKSEFALVNKRIFLSGYGNTIAIMDNDFSNTNDFKNWLSNNNVTCLYAYTTPTTTEITYQPLIDQLNLLEKAMSKDGQTNISQVNNDLPFIISASALKEWSV